MTPVGLLARLADQGAYLTVVEGGALRFHGPACVLNDEVREAIRAHKDALVSFLRRRAFAREELAALGFAGAPCADGSGMYEVRVDGSIEVLLLRLGLFGVEPEIRGDELWLMGRTAADNPEVVLPQALLEEARARAAEIDDYLRARGSR